MSVLQQVLLDSDKFDVFGKFLVDFPDEKNTENEQTHICIGYHMKNGLLKYSDKSSYIKRFDFKNKAFMSDIDVCVRSFINQDYKTDVTIPVKHFVFDFEQILLNQKMHKARNNEPLKNCEITDFEIATITLQIILKYRNSIDQFTSLKIFVDDQFTTSRKYFLIQFLFFILTFIVPGFVQLQFRISVSGVRTCMGICMFS